MYEPCLQAFANRVYNMKNNYYLLVMYRSGLVLSIVTLGCKHTCRFGWVSSLNNLIGRENIVSQKIDQFKQNNNIKQTSRVITKLKILNSKDTFLVLMCLFY